MASKPPSAWELDPSILPNSPPGCVALNPEELDRKEGEERAKDIILRVNYWFERNPQHGPPGLGLGNTGGKLLKSILRAAKDEKNNMPAPEKCENIAWNVRGIVQEQVEKDSKGNIILDEWSEPIDHYNAIMKHYNPNEDKTEMEVAKEACRSFEIEAEKQRETDLYRQLIKTITNNLGEVFMKKVKKISAFGGGSIVSHPVKSVCVFQHAFVLDLQELFEKSNSRKIPVTFQDPSYHAIDKLSARHLARDSQGGAEVVEDTKDRKPWVDLDQETFYISLQTPMELWKIILEITKPAAFLYDNRWIRNFFFKVPEETTYKIGNTYYRVPGTGAPKYTWAQFQEDYTEIQIDGVNPKDKILGWPCLYLRKKPKVEKS